MSMAICTPARPVLEVVAAVPGVSSFCSSYKDKRRSAKYTTTTGINGIAASERSGLGRVSVSSRRTLSGIPANKSGR